MSEVDLNKLYVMVGRPLTREQFEEVTQSLKNEDGKVLFVEKPAPAPGAEAAIEALVECLHEEHGLYELGKRVGERVGALTAGAAPYVECEESDAAILAARALHAKLSAALAALRGEAK